MAEDNETKTLIGRSRDPPGTKGPPKAAGAPSGDSCLSAYFLVIGTIIVTVLMLTVGSMKYLEAAYGGGKLQVIELRSEPPDVVAAKSTNLRIGEKKNNENTKDLSSSQQSMSGDDDFPDSEDEGRPEKEPEKIKVETKNDTSKEKKEKYKGDEKKSSSNSSTGNTEKEPEKTKDDEKTSSTTTTSSIPEKEPDTIKSETKDPKPKRQKATDKANEKTSSSTSSGDLEKEPEKIKVETKGDDKKSSSSSGGKSMLDSVLKARDDMVQKFREDYGDEYYKKIMELREMHNDETLPIRPFGPKDVYFTMHWRKGSKELQRYNEKIQSKYFHSVANLRRKMMIRILQAQTKKGSSKKYVWATGGHSAAAGHGNLFHETYTKVMEAAASKVFEAAGLKLEARNYAMGATSSASEMSMCFKEVYGDDVDIFSWDFGMLEARDYMAGRLLHYATRGLLSNKNKFIPAFVGVQEVNNARKNMMMELHESFRGESAGDDGEYKESNNGLALFLRDEGFWGEMLDAIPDTFGLNGDEIDELPEFVRYFKCGEGIEKGDPYCGENKYTMEACPDRMGRASWHPGWKYHALLGNSMALFLTQMLADSVQQMEEMIKSDDYKKLREDKKLKYLLQKLLEEEEGHWNRMINSQTSERPRSFPMVYWYNNTDDNWDNYAVAEQIALKSGSRKIEFKWKDLDREALFYGPSICHTARVPSQTRFKGYLTNQPDKTGEQVVFGKETYFTGIEEKIYHAQNQDLATDGLTDKSSSRDMQLVWVKHKEREENCGDVIVKPDYHDYFMAEEAEGWTNIEFPNAAERKAYGYDENKDDYKGILILVPRFCGFGKCEKGFLSYNEFNDGKWSMRVNGRNVQRLTRIGHDAILVEHRMGIFFEPNDDGIYRLEFKVNEPESFVKISAMVLY